MRRPERTLTVMLGVLTTIMVGWVLHVGAGILQPLVIALLLASMLQPVVRQLARWKIPPALTVILIVSLLFYGMFRGGLAFYGYVRGFARATPAVVIKDGAGTGDSSPVLNGGDPASSDGEVRRTEQKQLPWVKLRENIRTEIKESNLSAPMKALSEQLLDSINIEELTPNLVGSSILFTRSLVLVVIYMLFIFAEQAIFRRKILSLADERQDDVRGVLDTIGRGVQRYLGVKTIVSLLTGSLCYLVLVALKIPNAPLYGVMTFLLNYIPTFGSIIAAIPPTVTAFAEPSFGIAPAIIVVVTYLAVNFTLGSYLEPKILGRELGLSPLVIIISVVFWGGLWGVVGAFLAVPLTSILQIILASQENTRSIAIMLSSGLPKESRRKRRKQAEAEAAQALADEELAET
jgi:predicted PurR-regulated permease PerM